MGRELKELTSLLSKIMSLEKEVVLCETNVKESKVIKEGSQMFIILDMDLPLEMKEVFIKESIIKEALDDVDISLSAIGEFDSLDDIYSILEVFKNRMTDSLIDLMSQMTTLKVGDKIVLLEDLLSGNNLVLPKWSEVTVAKLITTSKGIEVYVGDEYSSFLYDKEYEIR